jgi:hypothetical protein
MFCKTVVLSLLLSSFGACVPESSYLVTAAPGVSSTAGDVESLRYTSNPAAAVTRETIALNIVAGSFSPYQQAKILRAVNEWNVALNGSVRFEIVSDGNDDLTSKATLHWVISARHGGQNTSLPTALAATYPALGIGGLMVIHVDRIGRRDLGGVVMHELGHVLGLGHDPKGRLMAALYHPSDQQCVDRTAAEAVAVKRNLPLAQLNWCQPSAASARR